jgi:NAD+ diphosphatase
MKDAESVTFAGGTLDRAAHLRGDAAALAADGAARCLALWRGKPLLDLGDADSPARLAWLALGSPVFAAAVEAGIFLGLDDGAPRFAREVPDWAPPTEVVGPRPFVDQERKGHPSLPDRYRFGDLRASMAELSAADAGNAAAAKGIFAWHERHRFCANCGNPSEIDLAGWRRRCPSCGAQHFPRTDPVVIMLILHGNSVLLGRSPGWPPGMYSLLAGFMEPGETIEAAVRREAFEEAGVPIGEVGYLASQPWPFPSSLMIGCRGEALSREIVLDPVELEDARWLSREAVMAALSGHDPDMRPARRGSIARFLLERWLADRLG